MCGFRQDSSGQHANQWQTLVNASITLQVP